jgi:hypothetical protein
MSVADIENLHVFVPNLSEHFIIFLGYFIILNLKMHRFCAVVVRMTGSVATFCAVVVRMTGSLAAFCAVVVRMTGSVATFCRLFGKKKLKLWEKHRLNTFYNTVLKGYLGF